MAGKKWLKSPDKPRSTNEASQNTMDHLEEQTISCPYCGEAIEVLIDHQDAGDQYIEDCQVCCRPILFTVSVDSAGNLSVTVRDENEAY